MSAKNPPPFPGRSQQTLERRLFEAVAGNSPSETLEALAQGANSNAVGFSRLLLVAVRNKAPSIVQILLANGADPSVSDGCGTTPLMAAASLGSISCVRILAAVSDLGQRDKSGRWACACAAASRAETASACLAFLFSETDKTRRDNEGLDALMIAATEGDADSVKFLSERMDLSAQCRKGWNALGHCAAARARKERNGEAILAYQHLLALATPAWVNARDAHGETLPMRLARLGAYGALGDFLPLTDLSLADWQGQTTFSILLGQMVEKHNASGDASFYFMFLDGLANRLSEEQALCALGQMAALQIERSKLPKLLGRACAIASRDELRDEVDRVKNAPNREPGEPCGKAPSRQIAPRRI